MPNPVVSSVSTIPGPPPQDIDLRLLEMEYEYVTNSSFHTDDLRDKFIQYYLIIVSVALTLIIGLIENTRVDVAIFAVISLVLFAIGLVLMFVLIRLRRIVWECIAATSLIKEYYKKHASHAKDLKHALLWDKGSMPSEKWHSVTSLLALLVAMLDSTMLGSALFLMLARPDLNANSLPDPLGRTMLPAIGLFAASAAIQWLVYFRRLKWENDQAKSSTRYPEKVKYWDIDLGQGDSSSVSPSSP
jgi:hypothetical protein